MAEDKRNQEPSSGGSTQQNRNTGQSQTQNSYGQEEQNHNPQNGARWNNYQTRELSDEGAGEGNPTTPRDE